MFKWLLTILSDCSAEVQGDGNPAGQGLGGSSTGNGDTGSASHLGDNQSGQQGQGGGTTDIQGTNAGQGQQAPDQGQAGGSPTATPKYGEFGDSPTIDQLFDAIKKERSGFETIKVKTTATERNLSALRKALESSGIRAVQGTDGNIKFDLIEKQQSSKKFTDQHLQQLAQMFDKPEGAKSFLDLLSLHVQDLFEEQYSTRQRATQEEQGKIQQLVKARDEQIDRMFRLYPMLNPAIDGSGKPTNQQFNKAMYELATEIWQRPVEEGGYGGHPLKQLLAAIDAAEQLGVATSMIQKAQAQGFQQGQAQRRVVGPVQSQSSAGTGAGSGAMRKLGKDEYLALSPEKREEYDAWNIQQRDKK